MKRLVVTLVVLLGLLLVADRAGAAIAGRAIAAQVQAEAGSSDVDVTVTGFPFLTQALAGRYDRVEVRAADVPAGEVTVRRLDATLTGVEVPLGEALSGSVTTVPVEAVSAQALLSYDQLTRASGDRTVTVAPSGDRVRVTGRVKVLGQMLSAVAVSRVEVVEGAVVVTAESYEVGNAAADAVLSRALGGRLDIEVPVTGLPYGLRVTGVEVRPDGVAIEASADATVIGAAG